MGKKKINSTAVGRSLIRDRFGHGKRLRSQGGKDNFLHTSDLNDGYDWGRLNLQSVTEQSNLDDFLTTAELAGTEFTAEKLNIMFVDPVRNTGLLSSDEKLKVADAQEKNRNLLCIPRRPAWDKTTTREELDLQEREAFLQWRRQLAQLQEVEHILMTPYEKNLDFWRQLWRVIERSDIIVQIVDARNPLLFRSEDLEKYVTEVSDSKMNLLLINKADFLTQEQREAWAEYFNKLGVKVAFWSALQETEVSTDSENDQSKTGQDVDIEKNEMENDARSVSEEDKDIVSETEKINLDCETNVKDSENEEKILEQDSNSAVENNRNLNDFESDDSVEKTKVFDQKINCSSSSIVVDETENRTSEIEEECKRDNSNQVADAKSTEIKSSDTNEADKGNNWNKAVKTDSVETETTDKNEVSDGVDSKETVKMDTSETVSSEVIEECKENSSKGDNSGAACKLNSAKVLTSSELLQLFRTIHKGQTVHENVTTIGMVGYPNVGKSSTINAILKEKKVPVSATPGRTKHFQTLFVDSDLMLCDCPGLVFPSFVSTKAQLVVSGILPVDQLREYIPPVSLVCDLIPRRIIEEVYNINLPLPAECEDMNQKPTAHELLNVYGYMRGFMTSKGRPDGPRSSRYILKDFVNGRLLYCHPPPGMGEEEFESTREPTVKHKKRENQETKQGNRKYNNVTDLDREFFRKQECKAHSRGVYGVDEYVRGGLCPLSSKSDNLTSPHTSQSSLNEKSWKKHNNQKKREKLRRIHSDLDK